MESKSIEKERGYPQLYVKWGKLSDHINLEIGRYNHSSTNEQKVKDLEIRNANLKKELDDAVEELKKTEEGLKEAEKKLSSSQVDSIAVLSIFTAVVFTAITSFDMISAISATVIGKFGLWGTLTVLVGVATVTIDVFYILLKFICTIIDKNNFIPGRAVKDFNFIAFAIISVFIILNMLYPQYVIT